MTGRALTSCEHVEAPWFLDARDLTATSKDVSQLRWDDLIWNRVPEVLA